MAAPVGAVVSITYDADAPVCAGHWLRSSSGRAYQVIAVRVVQRGPNAGVRHHLRAVVHDEVPQDAKVHPLVWYKRD